MAPHRQINGDRLRLDADADVDFPVGNPQNETMKGMPSFLFSKRKKRLWAAGIIMIHWACAAPYYFDLQAELPQEGQNWRLNKILMVEEAEINEIYRDLRIACRDKPFRVKYHTRALWAESPDNLLEDAVALFWNQRGIIRKVIRYGSSGDPDWVMRIHLDAIERSDSAKKWHARLAMDIEIADFESNETVLTHSFDRKSVLEKKDIRLLPEKFLQILHEELLKVEAKLRTECATAIQK